VDFNTPPFFGGNWKSKVESCECHMTNIVIVAGGEPQMVALCQWINVELVEWLTVVGQLIASVVFLLSLRLGLDFWRK
jgi:hypothetical protein